MLKSSFHKWNRKTGEITPSSPTEFEEDRRGRTVGDTPVGDYRVSTVFLGIDHGFGGESRWFETMVFGAGSYEDQFCERYATAEQAKAGHLDTVLKLRAGTLELYGEE